jgi:hypothetical protein
MQVMAQGHTYTDFRVLAALVISGFHGFDELASGERRTNISPFTKGCREWDASM